MFDLDAGKMLVFGIVALAVIPPKDLPRVLRTVGQYVGRMRRMAAEFQGQFMDAMKEAEKAADLESVKKELVSLDEAAKIHASFDPAAEVHAEMTKAIEPPKAIAASEAARAEEPATESIASEVAVTASPSPAETPESVESHAPSAP